MPKTLAEVETVSSANHRDSLEAPVLSNVTSTNNRKGITSNILVEVESVSKSYQRNGHRIPVLENINLAVPEGEFLALMGPSGSGKSTLLNLIAGIDRPDAGSIIVANDDVTKLSESQMADWRAHHIGFIFQFYNLIPVLTAYENVELPLLLTRLSKKGRDEHVKIALGVVGLSDRMKHYPKQLSGGQQQRVAIARAIVADPTLIVADEPTGDLDKNSAVEILTLLERLNKEFNKTIIMVTHDQRAADKAHTVRHLDKGELQ
jgi:putative ABC transport system ATP-binding protein